MTRRRHPGRTVRLRSAVLAALFGAAILGLAGCSPIGLVNALVPRDGYVVDRDVAYASGPRGRLDLYRPARADIAARAPLVVFLYGGGWEGGRKEDYLFVGEALASRGFIAAIPDYRVFPDGRYPDFLEDNAAALAWVARHLAGQGGDARRLYLLGHSAGAYNAVMLTLDRRWLAAVGLDVDRVLAGTVGLAGPYDFLPLSSATLRAIFGPEDDFGETQPVTHVRAGAPPLLLLTGTADTTVRPRNTLALADRLRAAGGAVETKTYADVGHVAIIAALAAPLRLLAPVLDDATAFMGRPVRPVGQATPMPKIRFEPQDSHW